MYPAFIKTLEVPETIRSPTEYVNWLLHELGENCAKAGNVLLSGEDIDALIFAWNKITGEEDIP